MYDSRLICGFLLFLLGSFISINAQTSSFTLETVPNPKDGGQGYVSNPNNIISQDEVNTLNRLIAQLEDSTTAQVVVVILQSIGDENPKEFAHQLFNKWGIGQAENDNGLLILTVLDQHRSEFETGYGLEGVLPDIICYRIGMQELVPEFKKERYGQGLINALIRIKQTLEDPEAAEEITANKRIRSNPYGNRARLNPLLIFLLVYAGITLIFSVYFISRILQVLRSKDELYDKYLSIRKIYWLGLLFIFPLPYIFIYLFLNKKLRSLRDQPRYSRETGELMRKLSEEEEDEYLEQGQITEEEIGSVDYDVWVSGSGDDMLVLRYKKRFTKYRTCPKCDYQTYYHAFSKTVRHPTYTSTGERKIVYKCKNCHHQKVDYKVIPRKQRSKGGGGGLSGGGGSSWGGGSSGGGGAGVSW